MCYIEKYINPFTNTIAKSLLNILDSETIALKTGLSVEEIEALRDV